MSAPDDPFAGLGVDRTIIMPMPGGRAAAPRPAPAEAAPEPAEALGVASGLNPLVAAANPLLNSILQLRNSVEHRNPNALVGGTHFCWQGGDAGGQGERE